MFSEYASRFLTKPKGAAPLFERSTQSLDTDTEEFLGWVDNSMSESSEDRDSIPPEDLILERQGELRPPQRSEGAGVGAEAGDTGDPAAPRPWDDRLEALVGATYIVGAAMTLAAATLVSFSPSAPSGVYPIFGRSAKTLGWLGVFSAVFAAAWLELTRRNPRGMVQLSVFMVPVACTLTSAYGLLGSWHSAAGHSLVHTAMRAASLAPLAAAAAWVYLLRRDKDKLGRASEMIALALKIVNNCTALVVVAAACGACASALTFLWVLFVSRATLEGSLSVPFALLFSFMYMWTWAVLCNMQRCLIAILATNYVHQHAVQDQWGYVVEVSRRFGACATSGLVSVLLRMPALVFGPRAAAAGQALLGAPVSLVRPLTLTVAVARRTSLAAAVQVLSSFDIDKSTYRLARMLLRSTKLTFAFLVALVGWVHADRVEVGASVYSYLIALAAFGVGWTVFGAAENTLGMVLESMMVNYALGATGELQRVF